MSGSDTQQTERYRQLAIQALTHYALDVVDVSLLSDKRNAVFKVSTHDGSRYAIHVYLPIFSIAQTQSALRWMHAVEHETDLNVPKLVLTREGTPFVIQSGEGISEARLCAVTHWIEGETLGNPPRSEDAYAWGGIMAQLHNHAEAFGIPDDFERPQHTSVFPYPDDPMVLFDAKYDLLMRMDARYTIWNQALTTAHEAIQQLWQTAQSSPMPIHADLHQANMMRAGDTYTVIDFEDVLIGYPVQDIGTAMYSLRWWGDDYPIYRAHFMAGYSQHRPWAYDDHQIDCMLVARIINIMNLILRESQQPIADKVVQRLIGETAALQHFNETGRIPSG